MALVNIVTFVVLKKHCSISFPCKTLYMQITADVTETLKAAQRDLTFISNVLSEFSIYFAWFSIVLSEMNVAIFA